MNSSKIAGFLARGIFAAMLGYCVWISGREFFHTHRAPPPEYISAYREIARKVNADPVAFLCENPSAISPLERSKLAVLAWELVPQAAEPIGLDNIDGRRGEIVASAYLPASVISKLETSGFASVASNEFATVWRARDDYSVSPYRVRYSANKEDAGLLCSIIPILFVFIVGCLLKGKQCGEKASYELTLAGIILGIVLSLITTSMNDASLAVPNGFAVFVGKAKLLMAEGGLPQGFFTNSIYSVYQPAYPLGMTILSAIAFLFSGGYYECSFMPTGPWLMFALVTILGDRKSVALSLSVGVLALSPLGRMLLTRQ